MIIKKWDKSIILTYINIIFSIYGIYLTFIIKRPIYPLICLLIVGICNYLNGFLDKKRKLQSKEKKVLSDVRIIVITMNSIILPIAIFINMGMDSIYHVFLYIFFVMGCINKMTSGENNNINNLLFPIFYLLLNMFQLSHLEIIYSCFIFLISFLDIININSIKINEYVYIVLSIIVIILLILFM